jgi:hypothetical protein
MSTGGKRKGKKRHSGGSLKSMASAVANNPVVQAAAIAIAKEAVRKMSGEGIRSVGRMGGGIRSVGAGYHPRMPPGLRVMTLPRGATY